MPFFENHSIPISLFPLPQIADRGLDPTRTYPLPPPSLHQTNVCVEAALLAGLETVQAPNWAGILKLYGQGGTISEALKDRMQVQLKDKARNLKLMILKNGQPLPAVLGMVTGSIKGRRGGGGRRRGRSREGEGNVMSMERQSQASFAMEEWSSVRSETVRN